MISIRTGSRHQLIPIAGTAATIVSLILWWCGVNVSTFLLATSVLLLASVAYELRTLKHSIPAANTFSSVAGNRPLFTDLRQFAEACVVADSIGDELHRDLSLEQIKTATQNVVRAANGHFEFESTERWRTYYSQLLTSPGLHLYRSVSIVRSPSYWQTEAGLKGMQLNHRLSEANSLSVERIVVLTDELWSDRNALPVERIQEWLIEQHHHGISLNLARESELDGERDLLVDMGIYGSRAVGVQELDKCGHTQRFTLQFGIENVQRAEQCWQRLLVHSVKYSDFLDRYSINA